MSTSKKHLRTRKDKKYRAFRPEATSYPLSLLNDQKHDSKQNTLTLMAAKSAVRSLGSSFLGTREYLIATGFRTSVASNVGNVLTFGLPTGPVLNAGITSTIVPEFSALSTLFDEFKVAGIMCRYTPVNPYNRGLAASVPLAFFWDDVDSTLFPTNSNAGMGSAAQRGSAYHSFSPDVQFDWVVKRPTSIALYDWTPVLASGTEPSTFGGLYVMSDGTGTANYVYGYLEYQFLCHFRMRQ